MDCAAVLGVPVEEERQENRNENQERGQSCIITYFIDRLPSLAQICRGGRKQAGMCMRSV